jgi:hypothetical protein
MRKIKELKDLIKTKSKEEMDNEAIRIMDEILVDLENLSIRTKNDPMIIDARKEYEIRKANGEWPDEA